MISNKVEAIKDHVKAIMDILEIKETESNKNTPLRIAKMWCNELFVNRNNFNIEDLKDRMALFPNDYHENEMVIVRDIPFSSTCEHHWLPFSGTATVGYVPHKSVIGLSKIPRIVKFFSKKPQLQEQLTSEICKFLDEVVKPKAVFIEVKAKHQCVMCRGAESDCETVTYAKIIHTPEASKYWEEFKTRL